MSVRSYFKRKAKTSLIVSTLSISFLLVLLGVVALVIMETSNLVNVVRENAEVQVFLSDDASNLDILALSKQISASGYAKNLRYVSKDDAKRILTEDLGEDFVDFVGYNPLKASLVLQLKSKYASSDSLYTISHFIKQNAMVTDIRYHQLLFDTINKNIKIFTFIGFGICAFFLILSLILIHNYIKLALFAERFLIKSMQLVGATKQFIRKPYLIRGLWQGFFAGLIASLLLIGLLFWINENVANLNTLLNFNDLAILFSVIFALSMLTTIFSSLLATNRYLNADIDELY